MKKILYILLLLFSFLGFGQDVDVNGARTVSILQPSPITISGTAVDATGFGLSTGKITGFNCIGGSITGTPAYDYLWTRDNVDIPYPDFNNLKKGTYKVVVNVKGVSGCTYEKTFVIGEPDKLIITIAAQTLTACSGGLGSLTATTKGGFLGNNQDYKYIWQKIDFDSGNYYPISPPQNSNIATGLVAGTYKVIVTDTNNITAEYIEVLTDDPKIEVTTTIKDVKCYGDNNGEISFAVTGGTPFTQGAPYKIIVTDINNPANVKTDLTQLAAGDYYYTVSDGKGCSFSTNPILISVAEPYNAFAVNLGAITQPSPTLNNGTIAINVTGGYGNYDYSWKKGSTIFTPSNNISLTGLDDGIYSVTVTDKRNTTDFTGCSKTIDLIVLKSLFATINVLTPINCIGDTTTLEAMPEGGSGSPTYKWFKGTDTTPIGTNKTLLNCTAGDYKVIVSDGQDEFTAYHTLNNPTNLPITILTSNQTDVNCHGGTDGTAHIEVSDGKPLNGIYTFSWNYAGTVSSTSSSSTISGLPAGVHTVTIKDQYCTKDVTFTILEPENAITIPAPTKTHVAINGQNTGSIIFSADPAGGTIGGYTYQWKSSTDLTFSATSKDIKNLYRGTYNLIVYDIKKCKSIQQNYTITEEEKLLVNIKESVFIKCNGDSNGKLTAEVSGGVAPYKYIWKKNGVVLSGQNQATISNLGFGNYSVYVTDTANPEPNGPFAQAEQLDYKLVQPDKLTVSLTKQTNVLCYGSATGSIEISIEGGTAPYTQTWTKDGEIYTGNLNQLEKGEYNVVVKDAVDHSCTTTFAQTIKITQPNAPLQVSSAGPVNLKGFETNDGSITVVVSGGTPNYTYEWRKNAAAAIIGNTPSITNLTAGIYHLIVKDANGCTLPQIDYTVTHPEKLEVDSLTQTPFTNIACNGDLSGEYTIVIKGGVKEYSFEWLNTSTGIKYTSIQNITVNSTASTASNLGAGNYVISVKDANNNTLFGTNIFTINQPDKLAFTYSKENVACFGGNNGTIQLNIIGGTKDADSTKSYTIFLNGQTIDYENGLISGLSAGNYNIIVADANGCQTLEQIITIEEPEKSVYISNQIITSATGFGLSTGKIAITAAGGTAPYGYQWKNNLGSDVGTDSPNLNNVPAGTYSLLITDYKGCPFSETYTVHQPSKPILTATPTQSKCNGLLGSLGAIANGGAAFNQIQSERIYTYKLKNKTNGITTSISGNIANFMNIADGDYTVTATDISGVDSNTIDVQFIQPSPILVTLISKSNVRCFGDQDGAIAISVSGGIPFLENGNPKYSYQWKRKNTATNNYDNFTPASLNSLSQGIYAVEVRDFNYNVNDTSHCIGILENIEITQPDDFGFDIDKITYTNPTTNGNDGKLHFEIIKGVSKYEYKFYTKDVNGNENIINTISESALKAVDFSNLTKDHYYISAKDQTGCIKYADFDFRDNPLTVSISQTQNITCNGYNNGILVITTAGGFGVKTISWYRNNILLSTDLLTDVNLNLLNAKPGTYYAVIKDFNKVEVTSNEITVTEPKPVIFSLTQQPVKCLGDSNGMVTLNASGGNGFFRYRYFSKNILIKDWTNFSNATPTTILNLAEGEYTIEVQDTQECTSQNAVIKVTSPTALNISNTTYVPATGKGLSNGSVSISAQGGNGNYTYQWFKSDNTSISQITNTAVNLPAGKYYIIITDAKGCSLTSPLLEVTEPPLLETSIAVQNVISCNGDTNGSLKPTSIGGFLNPGDNYTYKWYEAGTNKQLVSTTILNKIGKGSYYVIVRDSNGNEATSTTLIVTEPSILTNTITSDYMLCGDANNWTINATPSGGTAPYTYSWNNGIKTANLQNVPPANYWVKITDSHGCNITQNITITAPVNLAASENITIPTCYGGSDATIEITSSGGKAPYTYLWNTGEKSSVLKNAAAGNYSVTITDTKGCVINRNYSIVNPPKDIINLGEDVTLCFDQTLTINAAINDDKATYLWKSDKGFSSNKAMITISEPANYTVIVTNKLGCEATDTIKISKQNTAISAEFAVSSQVFKNEKIVIVDISNPIADEIEWVLPANATIVSKNKDYAEISFSEIGQYEITLNTKKGNCTAFQTKQIIVTEGEFEENNPDEAETEKKFDLKIYPNPSKGIFTVDVILDKIMPAHVKVYNLNNNLLIDSKSQEGKDNYLFNFSLSGLPAGLYFVLFESQQGSKLRKIIIQ